MRPDPLLPRRHRARRNDSTVTPKSLQAEVSSPSGLSAPPTPLPWGGKAAWGPHVPSRVPKCHHFQPLTRLLGNYLHPSTPGRQVCDLQLAPGHRQGTGHRANRPVYNPGGGPGVDAQLLPNACDSGQVTAKLK